MSKKKKAVLTLEDFLDYPPKPFLRWCQGALKKWLEDRGFDLSRPIEQHDNPSTFSKIFTQEE